MKLAGALALVMVGLAGCASQQRMACPAGQAQLRTAQIFLGRTKVNETDLRRFVDNEVMPRFPDGVTVVDGGGQWKGDANRLIREAAKVVLIVLPAKGDPAAEVEAVQTAYRTRFKQESVVVLPPPACVAL